MFAASIIRSPGSCCWNCDSVNLKNNVWVSRSCRHEHRSFCYGDSCNTGGGCLSRCCLGCRPYGQPLSRVGCNRVPSKPGSRQESVCGFLANVSSYTVAYPAAYSSVRCFCVSGVGLALAYSHYSDYPIARRNQPIDTRRTKEHFTHSEDAVFLYVFRANLYPSARCPDLNVKHWLLPL